MMKALNEAGAKQFSFKYLQDAMRIIEEAYAETCSSLKLSTPTESLLNHIDATIPGTCLETPIIRSEDPALADTETDEDIDWFFSTDEPEETLSTPDNIYGSMYGNVDEEESDSSEDTSLSNEFLPSHTQGLASTSLSDPVGLAAGLQHCLPFDYASHWGKAGLQIALPMQLAMQVSQHLFEDHPKNPHNESDPLFEMCGGEGSLKAVLQTHLHVHAVPGLSAHRCGVYPNALLLSCATRDMDRAKNSSEHSFHKPQHINNTTDFDIKDEAQTIAYYIFRRTVVLQANIGMIGQHFVETNRTLGNSQQARSINVTKTMSADTYLHSLQHSQVNENQKYVNNICAILKSHRVNLVLCEVGMMTTELVDTLSTYNIAILPISTTKELNSAADLCNATVLDDIIGMCEQDIGTMSLQLQYLLQLPTIAVPTGTLDVKTENLDTPESAAETSGLEGKECLVVLSRYQETTTGSMVDSDMGNVYSTQPAEDAPRTPVSVLICAPTEAMVRAVDDKFHKCLHRLRAVCEDDGTVMIGAGLPELLCVLRLEEIKATLSESDSNCRDTNINTQHYHGERMYCLCVIIECFQRCLQQYILCIIMNNGYSFAQATERIHHVASTLLQLHNNHKEMYNSSSGILSYSASLSLEEKLALPAPIDLDLIYENPALQHVLDPVRLKANTVNIACSLVLQLSSIKYV